MQSLMEKTLMKLQFKLPLMRERGVSEIIINEDGSTKLVLKRKIDKKATNE